MRFKDSGIEWLGEIPEYWEVRKLEFCFYESDERCGDKNYELLSVTQSSGIVKQNDLIEKKDISNDDKTKYKVVPLNAIAYNKMRMWQGALGLNNIQEGIISPAYVVAIPKKHIFPSFAFYLFKTQNMIEEFGRFSYGLCSDMNSLRYEDFKNIQIPLPPLKEQKAIAEFLDKKCDKISQFIESKQKLITLLQEKKQALINAVVCRGLNKNAEFKESGVKYLGTIPKHWEVRKLKYLAYIKGRIGFHGLKSNEFQYNEGAYLVTGNDFFNDMVNWDKCRRISEERYYEDSNIHLRNDDLLITKDGTIGKTAIVKACPTQATLNSGVLLVRVDRLLCFVKYLFYVINSQCFKEFIISKTCGSTIIHLYQSDFNEFKIPLPPLQEQKAIASYLDTQITKIDLAIEKTKQQITYIKEYKTSLINQAICGRIALKD